MSVLIAFPLLEGVSYVLKQTIPWRPIDRAGGDNRLLSPNWSAETTEFFSELHDFRGYRYESFIGWKSEKRAGRFINLDDDGNRITANNPTSLPTTVFDFYGGSTIWGFGVSDTNTIPSRFARLSPGIIARNFGEQARNSRQELNYFLNNAVRGRVGNIVIFYDGFNDVKHQCSGVNGPFGDARTGTIRSVMAQVDDNGQIRNLATGQKFRNVVAFLLPNTTALIERITRRPFGQLRLDMNLKESNICHDSEMADLVAENLVQNWRTARLVANDHGATFFAILQPLPYTADVRQPYYNPGYDEVIKAVYPIIKAKAERFGWFIDGEDWLNGRTDLYIDACCHVNEKGSELIAEEILRRTIPSETDRNRRSSISSAPQSQ